MFKDNESGDHNPFEGLNFDTQEIIAEHKERQELLAEYREIHQVVDTLYSRALSHITGELDLSGRHDVSTTEAAIDELSRQDRRIVLGALSDPEHIDEAVLAFEALGWDTTVVMNKLTEEVYNQHDLAPLNFRLLDVTYYQPLLDDADGGSFSGFTYRFPRDKATDAPDNIEVTTYTLKSTGQGKFDIANEATRDVELEEFRGLMAVLEIVTPELIRHYAEILGLDVEDDE